MKEVMLGVPQGSLLAPKLYSLHVNDLPLAIMQGEPYLFTDDTACKISRQTTFDCFTLSMLVLST